MEDARRHPRTRIDFPVNVVNYGAGSRDDGRIIVLGQGGASLELSGNYSVGSMLRLGFELPATKGEITCTAIVRGRRATGVGVEFLQLEPQDRGRVSGFVSRNLSAPPPR